MNCTTLKRVVIIFCKKGRGFLLLPFLLFVISCAKDFRNYGKVELQNRVDKSKYFTFTVSDEFLQDNKDSPKDKKNPKITEAESGLLIKLLQQKNYCNEEGLKPSFVIISRQEKIYDMTFAHLIEQNYKARPVTPLTYYGRCKNNTKN